MTFVCLNYLVWWFELGEHLHHLEHLESNDVESALTECHTAKKGQKT